MKTILFALTFSTLLVACSSSKKGTANSEMMQVVNATFQHWNESITDSDLAERGTDMTVTLTGWPEEYSPVHIIFRGKKSFTAEVIDHANGKVVIRGRIIHESAVLKDKSASVNLSDRLVFKKSDGETGFIEISDWKRVES